MHAASWFRRPSDQDGLRTRTGERDVRRYESGFDLFERRCAHVELVTRSRHELAAEYFDPRIDTGAIAEQTKEVFPSGVDKVLELIGTTTLGDSLRCAKQRGIVCMTGMVGNKWSFEDFSPMA